MGNFAELALLFLDFVTTKVLLSLGKDDVLTKDWIVLAKSKLVWSIHRILLGVILTDTRFLRNETNKLALSIIFLCHIKLILAYLAILRKEE